jgi:hypothetical protein
MSPIGWQILYTYQVGVYKAAHTLVGYWAWPIFALFFLFVYYFCFLSFVSFSVAFSFLFIFLFVQN